MRVDPIFHQNQPTNNDKMSVASRSTVLDLALLGLSVFVAILSFAKSYSRKLNPEAIRISSSAIPMGSSSVAL